MDGDSVAALHLDGPAADADELRMYLVVRDDLDLAQHVGKAMGQAGHAFGTALMQADPVLVASYLRDHQTKVVVKCKNEAALLRAEAECRAFGLNCFLVTDAGRTVFPEPTPTCLAIGPCVRAALPKFVHKMQLF